jgi:hypothetical protein
MAQKTRHTIENPPESKASNVPFDQDGRQRAEDDKQTLTGIKAGLPVWAHSRKLNAMHLCGRQALDLHA